MSELVQFSCPALSGVPGGSVQLLSKSVATVVVALLSSAWVIPAHAFRADARVDDVPPPALGAAPSPRDHVNALPYSYGHMDPVNEAYTYVATHRGWTSEQIEAWRGFIVDIVRGESGGCYNLRRGARLASGGRECQIARQGRGTDSGFFQIIRRYHWHPRTGWLCRREGYCSSEALTSNAWDSMNAGLALVERNGRQPWCFDARARRIHKACATAPQTLPGVGR